MRTVTNVLPSGFAIRMSDTGAQKVQWQLRYTSLTDTERSAIENLFESSEGQLNTFTFLDPLDNLLMWSEDWTQAVWAADPMLDVTGGLQDPMGGSGAMQLTNTSQASQQILQSAAAPSSYRYAYSVYLRSNVRAAIQLVVSGGGQTVLSMFTTGGSWMRAVILAGLTAQGDGIGFGLQLPAGTQVEAFGAQAEAQPEAGLYKKTIDLGGVYPSTRFVSDALTFSATAPNQNSCEIELISSLV